MLTGGKEAVDEMRQLPAIDAAEYFAKAQNDFVDAVGVESAKNPKIPHR